jgi:hypothetical protein
LRDKRAGAAFSVAARVTESNLAAAVSGLIGCPLVQGVDKLHQRLSANNDQLEIRRVKMRARSRLLEQRLVEQRIAQNRSRPALSDEGPVGHVLKALDFFGRPVLSALKKPLLKRIESGGFA